MDHNNRKKVGKRYQTAANRKRLGTFLLQGGLGVTAAMAFVVVGALVLQAAAPRTVPVEVSGGPHLKLFQDYLNLGDQPLGRTVPVSFEIANTGDRPLLFSEDPYLEVVQGCCPSTPRLGSKTLMPGQTTTVSFSMMMHTGMGGYHDFRLHLKTNDPSVPDRTITIISNWV